MIEVSNLTKTYSGFKAVDRVSFTAQPGQVTGFLGPNGAGKTTTMRILTGFMPPTSGQATVAGYDVFDDSLAVRQQVGYLPENVPLYRDMSALAYLMYVVEIRGLKDRRQRAMDALDRVGLVKRAKSRIRTLSKGMKQRVGLAAALIHDPQVLILDEPTIGLDPLQVLELRDLVSELGRDHTVLFSTHILSEAEQVCDQVVIINRGTIIGQGSPTDLRDTLERGQRVMVRVSDKLEDALATVQQLKDNVKEAYIERDSIIIEPASDEFDPRPIVAQALINAGFDLMEVRPAANNLEEIFLELTRGAYDAEGRRKREDEQTDAAEADEAAAETNDETESEDE